MASQLPSVCLDSFGEVEAETRDIPVFDAVPDGMNGLTMASCLAWRAA